MDLVRFKKEKKDRKGIGTVMLPVPGGITDQNNADWGDGRINPLQAAGLQAAGTALSKGFEAGLRDCWCSDKRYS